MNHKQLEALIYLSRNGNFSKAAEMLYFDSHEDDYITPETLQYRIKTLEDELGVTLYKRAPGVSQVTLTREGNLFLQEAIAFYQRMEHWRTMFTTSGQGKLSFAATELVILHRLVDPVKKLVRKYPDLQLEVSSHDPVDIEQLVRSGQVDFGLATHPPDDQELEYVVWKRSQLLLVMAKGHPLTAKERITLEDVAEHPLILLFHDLSRRDDRARIDMAFRRRKIANHNKVVMVTSNSEIVNCYVEAGIGLGIVPETALLNSRREIESRDIGDMFGPTEVGILVRQDKVITPAMRDFFLFLSPKFAKWMESRSRKTGGANRKTRAAK